MTISFYIRPLFFTILLLITFQALYAQTIDPTVIKNKVSSGQQVQYDSQGRIIPPNAQSQSDSLQRRDNNKDSITIYFRYYDSTRIQYLDTTINNFYSRYPVPPRFAHLGNLGTAARSLVFDPLLKPGWDAGFHAFDIYRLTVDQTKFYNTTRPYTEMSYMLGSVSEQMINILHTQNIKPNFNMAFQYRFINAPGSYKNQNTGHNNYRINGHYQSNNKRYTAYGIFIGNNLKSSENGGIASDSFLKDNRYNDRFLVPTRLGTTAQFGRNFFNTTITAGNLYNESIFLFKHQYDIGQRDSIVVNDSTTIKLFYPRLRFQHTLSYSKQKFQYQDNADSSGKRANYKNYFDYDITSGYPFFRDSWSILENELSLISFPEKNNLNQFVKAGFSVQNLVAQFGADSNFTTSKYHNLILSGEYRNRTRNQKWDIAANGKFYFNGLNSGDYSAQFHLKRYINKKLGFIDLGFQNVNRSPSFVHNAASNFPVVAQASLNKENSTRISASLLNDAKNFTVTGNYYIVSNYTYFNQFLKSQQEATLFNVLHISAQKIFKLRKNIYLTSELHLQQTAGNPPINLPLLFSNNRITYEAHWFKNLYTATGLELIYHTPYKADNYSPMTGQFFYQDQFTLSNRPTVNAFFNFKIKTFKAFVRVENLNTLGNRTGTIGFTDNNFSAQYYPQQTFWFRLGIWWTFIN